jgi:predicted ABC-type ATPase
MSDEKVKSFFRLSTFSPVKRNEPDLWLKIFVDKNILKISTAADSYLAADLAEFIRKQLLESGISFTYETVMSHPGKIDFLQQAIQKGFKVYLYYIATVDPDINISRLDVRIAQNGHAVPPEIIRNRYYKSLQNLKNAVKQSNSAYIFDNSQKQARLIAKITNGSDVVLNNTSDTPSWVIEYLLG